MNLPCLEQESNTGEELPAATAEKQQEDIEQALAEPRDEKADKAIAGEAMLYYGFCSQLIEQKYCQICAISALSRMIATLMHHIFQV